MDIEGPDFPRRKIRNSELFRSLGQTNSETPGLDYRCYEGWWTDLPDFGGLKPVKTGIVDNFELRMRTRDEGVGLEFAGFFEVARPGRYKFYLTSDDGSRLYLGRTRVQADIISQDEWPIPRHLFIGQILDENQDDLWSWLEGKVTDVWPDEDGLRMELSVGRSRIEVGITGPVSWTPPELLGKFVRVTGFCQGAYNSDGVKTPNLLLAPSSRQLEVIETLPTPKTTNGNPAGLPVLTTAAKVHRLKREEAQLGYPVDIQGIVTGRSPVGDGFTLQDSTRGLFVEYTNLVQVGEFVELTGQTDPGNFAPMLVKSTVRHLGEGRLPEPLRPTWDQLMNGSLTSQFVEIEGIVMGANQNGVQLLTPGGPVHLRFNEVSGSEAIDLEMNTLVQIRGVLHVEWNAEAHRVNLEGVWMWDPKVTVAAPAKADMLSLPYKTPGELLLFDFQASSLQRIRMSGQIVHVGAEVCCMMVGASGVRFIANSFGQLVPGNIVDVAGYPQLGGASSLLRQAEAIKTGHASLPEARTLPAGHLVNTEWDATRVQVEGVLTETSKAGSDRLLILQDGAQNFVARVSAGDEVLQSLPIGSRLELVGVYAVQEGRQGFNHQTGSFEVLLNSMSDVKILARPPWWTLRRLLVVVGTLAGVLVIAILWITQLHRTVEERTVQLTKEIEERRRIEQHRATEKERARVAQDLHDELGSGLTEISMLAAMRTADEGSSQHLDQIGDRARDMVTALDEIVWAMSPKHDSLESLGSYLCLYADRFLKLMNITCNLKGTFELPAQDLNSVHRHEFFLAFKEGLANVVHHSGATEVRLSIRIIGHRLRVSLADNGSGLGRVPPTLGNDGLASMRIRMEKIGGRFAIASKAGRGTTLRFYLPLH